MDRMKRHQAFDPQHASPEFTTTLGLHLVRKCNMSGPPVSIGCAVLLSPGAAGPPDSGVITMVPQAIATASGMPLATAGSLCQMINSLSGVPYVLPIGPGGSTLVLIAGQPLVRIGDMIPSGPGVMSILGPPAVPYLIDTGTP
jgi:uncharacterized Zn-binding protein involved in type VI secretion